MRFIRLPRRAIEQLPPYPSLLLVAVPLAVVEPLKLAVIVIVGRGHWITGALAMIGAYATSLFVADRIFVIVKPKLLTLPWFAACWKWFLSLRGKVFKRLRNVRPEQGRNTRRTKKTG